MPSPPDVLCGNRYAEGRKEMVRHQDIAITDLIRFGFGGIREHIAPSEEFNVIVLQIGVVPCHFLKQEV
jgi:hypothetical protein